MPRKHERSRNRSVKVCTGADVVASLVRLALLLLLVASPRPAIAQWTQALLSPREGAAMAHDSRRGVTVLFGGLFRNSLSATLGDTWEWDGTRWTERIVPGPSRRYGPAMAYDARRGVTVLFGGSEEHGYSCETWEWNGGTWTQRLVAGPSPRVGHGMAYDTARGVVVLFGGRNDQAAFLDEVWEWDGTVWTLRAGDGPSGRYGFGMCYDETRSVVVVFGGWVDGSGGFGGDTWEWNGEAWTQRAATGPQRRASCIMTYDSHRGVSVLYGGFSGLVGLSDTWEWNGAEWRQAAAAGAPATQGMAMAFDSTRGSTVLFGGDMFYYVTPGTTHHTQQGETWTWDGLSWLRRASSGPSPRNDPAMAFDSDRGVAVMFGGDLGMPPYYNFSPQTWEWNGSSWAYRTSTGPAGRVGTALAFDAGRHLTVLFGGGRGTESLETWEWNGDLWERRNVAGPSGRSDHAMAYDVARHRVVLFGGWPIAGGVPLGDTWEWDGIAWTMRQEPGPSGRAGAAMAYDSRRSVTILFGGYTSSAETNETWEWDGLAWTRRTASGPAPRTGHSMVFDAARSAAVVFGGYSGSATRDDTWEWDGVVWTERVGSAPLARAGAPAAYDSARSAVVLFGGSLYSGDTWELDPPCTAPLFALQPVSQSVAAGSNVVLSISAQGGGSLSYQWQKNGQALVNGGRVHGVDTTTLHIDQADSVDSGWYSCTVSGGCGSAVSRAALLTVACYANCDGSTAPPVLNINDFVCFQSKFAAGDPYANCDGSTSAPVLNINDFVCFQASFAAGCE